IPRSEVFAVGQSSYEAFRYSPLGVKLMTSDSILRAYEKLFYELLGYLENNCTYSLLRVGSDSLMIRVTSLADVAEALKVKHLGSENLCAYKAGVFATVPQYLGLPSAQVTEQRCAH